MSFTMFKIHVKRFKTVCICGYFGSGVSSTTCIGSGGFKEPRGNFRKGGVRGV